MTLARLTNYVDGNTLTGVQLNNEFDNILNNGPALVSAAIPGVSIVQGLRGSLISNIGSFAANGYQLKSTSTIATLTATSSYSINTQTAGPVANGRDQAAVFASTDVHFYAITTGGTSTNAAGICSSVAPPTGPTLPAGYSAWAYLASAKYSTASSAMVNAWRVAGAQISAPATILLSPAIATSAVTGVETTILLSARMPAIATHMTVSMTYTLAATGPGGWTSHIFNFGVESSPATGNYDASVFAQGFADSTGLGQFGGNGGRTTLPNLGTPTIYGLGNFLVGSTGSAVLRLTGYTVPNGDVG